MHFVLLLFLACFGPAVMAAPTERAASQPVEVYFFWRTGCPHCEREQDFLRDLRARHPGMQVQSVNLWDSAENRALFARVGQQLQVDVSAVPLTVVGDRVFSGYFTDTTTGAEIAARVQYCAQQGCPDSLRPLLAAGTGAPPPTPAPLAPTVTLPVFGTIALADLSLPVLTLVLAALDGFNPCAMWTLVLLLGFLVGQPDRARRWLLGGAFIGASAFVYFLFLAAWLNLFLFLGLLPWVRVLIGAVALTGGAYYLRQYWLRRDAVCAVTTSPARRRVWERLGQLTRREQLWLALTGIVLLVFAVNLIELLCSAGIPAVYTQLLALAQLPTWQYYLYLTLYIVVFMLDDLIVFIAAMKTLELTGLSTRYTRASHLIGGLVLVAIGVLLWARPEWLMFG